MLRRYRPPRDLRVQTGLEGPVWIEGGGLRGEVVARRGPWRLSGHWWDLARAWDREEWDVELASGGIYRLARLGDGSWVADGMYD